MDVNMCRSCKSLNVSVNVSTGEIHCRDCGEDSGYKNRQVLDFTQYSDQKKQEDLDKIMKDIESGVEYDLNNDLFQDK